MKKRMLTRAIALLLTVIMLAIPLFSCANEEEAVENSAEENFDYSDFEVEENSGE